MRASLKQAFVIVPIISEAAFASAVLGFADHSLFGLHERQIETCGGDRTLTACGNGRPSNWCCPQTAQCLSLNNTGTQAVLCCPSGSSCSSVQTISCDAKLQDASLFPNSALHISNLTITLPACGSRCCPVGYDCQNGANGQSYCKAQEKTFQSQTSSVSPSPMTSTTSTSTSTGSSTSSSSTANAEAARSSSHKGLSGGVIAAIVVPILLGALIVVVALCLCRKKAKHKRVISDPILDPQTAARSDFLSRRSPQLSISNRVSPMSGTIIRAGTPDSISPLAPHQETFMLAPPRPVFTRPLPKAPTNGSPEMRSQAQAEMSPASMMQQESMRTMQPRTQQRSPLKGTMTSQHTSGLYTLPNARYQPPT